MIFTETYFQGEKRNGFYVKPMMKRVWAAQLEILKVIEKICNHHDLKYFAYGGTLLGAVRHQGYIPWDDDMDLGMLRVDYDRFRHYAKTELPEGWFILDTQPTVIRIMNSAQIRIDPEFLDQFHGCPYMMGVDIFCWDSVPHEKNEEKIALNLFWSIAYLAVYWDQFDENSRQIWEEAREEGARNVENFTGYHFDWNRPMKEQLTFLADKVAAMYWDDDCKEVTRPFLLHERSDYRVPRSCVEDTIEVPYENTTILIPKEYDALLRLDYGKDYMVPMRDYFHSYPFFLDQVNKLREDYEKKGEIMPERFAWEVL